MQENQCPALILLHKRHVGALARLKSAQRTLNKVGLTPSDSTSIFKSMWERWASLCDLGMRYIWLIFCWPKAEACHRVVCCLQTVCCCGSNQPVGTWQTMIKIIWNEAETAAVLINAACTSMLYGLLWCIANRHLAGGRRLDSTHDPTSANCFVARKSNWINYSYQWIERCSSI